MRRMLDPKEAGMPSTVEFDTEGNRTVGKNLGVDGKLTLKSLVSASNPDGDITKELGKGGGGEGGKIYLHSIYISSSEYYIYINIYSTSNKQLTIKTFEQLILHYGKVICTGFYTASTTYGIPTFVQYNQAYNGVKLYYFDTLSKTQSAVGISSGSVNFNDSVAEIA